MRLPVLAVMGKKGLTAHCSIPHSCVSAELPWWRTVWFVTTTALALGRPVRVMVTDPWPVRDASDEVGPWFHDHYAVTASTPLQSCVQGLFWWAA